jgi:predicted amidophosphoribosyltransferase
VARLGTWRELGDLIVELKFRRRWELALPLGQALATVIRTEFEDVLQPNCVVVPMPMPPWRRIERGLDHALELARGVSKGLDVPLVKGLRRRAGQLQSGQSRAQRLANPIPGLSLTRAGKRLRGPVLLIDDVLSTGRTATSACGILRSGPVLLGVIAVAGAEPGVAPTAMSRIRQKNCDQAV